MGCLFDFLSSVFFLLFYNSPNRSDGRYHIPHSGTFTRMCSIYYCVVDVSCFSLKTTKTIQVSALKFALGEYDTFRLLRFAQPLHLKIHLPRSRGRLGFAKLFKISSTTQIIEEGFCCCTLLRRTANRHNDHTFLETEEGVTFLWVVYLIYF